MAVLISIHAPREGSDHPFLTNTETPKHFNPRSPRGERLVNWNLLNKNFEFQSTLPARGATRRGQPRALPKNISIHAPREGSDASSACVIFFCVHFNPRSPRGERPSAILHIITSLFISIHAPREGSDPSVVVALAYLAYFNPRSPRGERHRKREPTNFRAKYFNPRSPRGERPAHHRITAKDKTFQSTLPARGATPHTARYCDTPAISIHAPREGSD